MKRGRQGRFLLAAALLSLLLVASVALLSLGTAASATPDTSVRILVKAPPGQSAAELAEDIPARFAPQHRGLLRRLSVGKASAESVRVKRVLERTGWVAVEVPASVAEHLAEEGYRVEEDREVHALLVDSVPLINATQVWALKDANGNNLTGRGITIAILDTGINYSHPDLGGCTNTSHLAGNCRVLPGYDYVNNDSDAADDHYHGTHVAGIAAANGTLKGVAPDATLVAYKVLDSSGSGYDSDIIAAIENATDAGYDVISLSLGGLGNATDAMSGAVDTAVNAGAIVVIAAGNSGPGGNSECRNGGDGSTYSICSPGTARLAITVGNTDDNDALVSSSSRGPNPSTYEIKPELTAPGSNIVSTSIDGPNETLTGTSMSAPHVSGAAALLKQFRPGWGPAVIKAALVGTAKDIGLNVTDQGAGRIRVLDAVNASFVSLPSQLSLGVRSLPLTNVTAYLNLSELSNVTYNVSLTASLRTGSTTVEFNASTVELSALGNASVRFVITLTATEPTIYSGLITVNSSVTNISIPFWLQTEDTVPPAWSGNATSIPATYSPTTPSIFNISWTDGASLSRVLFESNISGSPVNYTMNNITASVYNFSRVLAAGSYYWKSYANDSSNNKNRTGSWGFSIARATPTLTITNTTPGNTTYSNVTNVTCAASSEEVMPVLYRNSSNITNSEAVLLAVGTWTFTCNSSQTANYTAATAALLNITINKATPVLNLTLNGTAGAVTVGEGSSIWLNGSVVTGDGGATLTLSLDGTSKGSGSSVSNLTTFSTPGTYNVSLNYTATQNYTAGMVSYLVIVTDLTAPVASAPLNVTPSSFNKNHQLNFSINWTDNFNLSSVGIEVNRSGALALYTATNQTAGRTSASTLWNLTLTDFPAGTHYWRSNASDGAGNVNTTGWNAFTITQAVPTLNLTLNGTAGAVTIANGSSIWLNGSVVTGDGGAILTLVLNGTQLYNSTNIANLTTFSTPGTYNVSLNYTATPNFTAGTVSYLVTVIPPDECGVLNESKTLTSNITATGTCFTINASNIVLDGAGYTITGDGSGYGISSTGNFDNFTVRNFGGINNFSVGVLLDGVNNNLILIYNNSITSQDTAIFFDQIIYSNISANTLSTTGNGGSGITLRASFSNTLDSNTITSVANNSVGINMTQSVANTLSNNIISVNGSGSSWGVWLFASAGSSFNDTQINSANSYEIVTESTGFPTSTTFTNVVLAGTVNFTSHSISNVSIDVNTTAKPADPSGKHNLSDYLTITNTSAGAFINFNLSYADSDVSGIGESTVRIYRYNESAGTWEVVNSSSVDTASNTVRSGNITADWGLFAPFGDSDITAPVVLSHSPTGTVTSSSTTLTATTDENATCRYSTAAGTAYASMDSAMSGTGTSHTASLTGLSSGTYHYYIRCNDTAGNAASIDYDAGFTVSISTGGGGGGGSAGITTTADTAVSTTNVIASVSEAKGVDLHISKESIPLSKIEVAVTGSATNVEIQVSATDEKPESVAEPPRSSGGTERAVYKYLEIEHKNLEGKIKEATLEFKVAKAWLADNEYDKSQVVLQRHTGTVWEELPTGLAKETAANVYYTATTPGFSVFAITVKEEEEAQPEAVAEEAPEGQPVEPPVEPPAEQPAEPPEQPPAQPPSKAIFQSLAFTIAVATILASAGIGYIFRERLALGAKIEDLLGRLRRGRKERLGRHRERRERRK